jgi:osmotically-inducible protein OsmY
MQPARADITYSQELTMTRAATTGARRTDTEIFAQARKSLDERPSIPATVRVHIDNGTAWLTGTVRLTSQRVEAEDVVRQVPGVQHIVNKIAVAQPASPEGFEPPDIPV